MEARGTLKKTESTELPRDPFAVDIFGGASGQESDVKQVDTHAIPLPEGVSLDWHSGLENTALIEEDDAIVLPPLSGWLEKTAGTTVVKEVARFFKSSELYSHFEIISFDRATDGLFGPEHDPSKIFVMIEAGGETAVVVVSTEFASDLLLSLLGGHDEGDLLPRALSKIERSVVEYLFASGFTALNSVHPDGPAFRILSAGHEPPVDLFSEEGGFSEIVADAVLGDASGMVSVFLPFSFLRRLNREFPEELPHAVQHRREINIERAFGRMRLNIEIGRTRIGSAEIPFLEKNDVILVVEPVEEWWESRYGETEFNVTLGNSVNTGVRGRFIKTPEGEFAPFGVTEVFSHKARKALPRILSVSGRYARGATEMEPETPHGSLENGVREVDDKGRVAEGNLIALENVMVDLRVQVGGKRISLGELRELSAGKVIDLGCRPDDPVEVIAESSDQPIASGELVKIDGQLGVRITKVFV
ncbi:MAG: FliM/FliN family flagellar motor switch protein [Pyrinomonadaceae bacterium]